MRLPFGWKEQLAEANVTAAMTFGLFVAIGLDALAFAAKRWVADDPLGGALDEFMKALFSFSVVILGLNHLLALLPIEGVMTRIAVLIVHGIRLWAWIRDQRSASPESAKEAPAAANEMSTEDRHQERPARRDA